MLSLVVYGNDRLSLIFCVKYYGEWAVILLNQKGAIDKKYYK